MVESDLCVSLILPPALALLQGEIFCHPLHIMKFLTPSPLVEEGAPLNWRPSADAVAGNGWDGGRGLEHQVSLMLALTSTEKKPTPESHQRGGDCTPSGAIGCRKPPPVRGSNERPAVTPSDASLPQPPRWCATKAHHASIAAGAAAPCSPGKAISRLSRAPSMSNSSNCPSRGNSSSSHWT